MESIIRTAWLLIGDRLLRLVLDHDRFFSVSSLRALGVPLSEESLSQSCRRIMNLFDNELSPRSSRGGTLQARRSSMSATSRSGKMGVRMTEEGNQDIYYFPVGCSSLLYA